MNLSQENLDFLEHYGVKGMRWGVRKDRRSGRKRSKTSSKKKKSLSEKLDDMTPAERNQLARKISWGLTFGILGTKIAKIKIKEYVRNNPDKIIRVAKAVNRVVRPHVRPSDTPVGNVVDAVWRDA